MSAPSRRAILAVLGLSVMCAAQTSDAARETFTVTGNVNNPGTYEIHTGVRIAEAIAMAGGFTESAQTRKVHVLRRNLRFTFNYEAFERGRYLDSNISLVGGDTVEVP